jgi:dipeptidase E
MKKLNMLLFSGGQAERKMPYYHYCKTWLHNFLNTSLSPQANVFFISWAVWGGHDADKMFSYGKDHWGQFGLKLKPLHKQTNYVAAIHAADAIIVGGGSIHVLVNELEKRHLMKPLKEKVQNGCLYVGTSAGSVIAGPTMHTAAEPPLIHIPSHKTLGILPFQINTHYYDIGPTQFHNGPTPEARIKNYLQLNPDPHPVACMRDGSFLHIHDGTITTKGIKHITIIDRKLHREDFPPESDLKPLLNKRSHFYHTS